VQEDSDKITADLNASSKQEEGIVAFSADSQFEMQPLTSPEDSYSYTFKKDKVLRRQLSWFKVPSFKEMSGQIKSASTHLGLTELMSGSNVQRIGVRSMLTYFMAQSRAAVRPIVLSHFLKLALPGEKHVLRKERHFSAGLFSSSC
jgi:hypothetical protein